MVICFKQSLNCYGTAGLQHIVQKCGLEIVKLLALIVTYFFVLVLLVFLLNSLIFVQEFDWLHGWYMVEGILDWIEDCRPFPVCSWWKGSFGYINIRFFVVSLENCLLIGGQVLNLQ